MFVIAAYTGQAAGTDFHGASAGITVTVPDGWVQIPDSAFRLGFAWLATQSNSNPPHCLAVYQQKNDDWFRYPLLYVGTMPYSGNAQPSEDRIAKEVKMLTAIDVYRQMKDDHSELFSKVILGASVESAQWDGARHVVYAVGHTNVATWGLVKSYNAICFAKREMILVACSDTDDQFEARLPLFRKTCQSFRFDPGFAYDPSLSPPSQSENAPASPQQMRIFGEPIWTWVAVIGVGLLIGLIRATARSNQSPDNVHVKP
jgi:hypothetical protein